MYIVLLRVLVNVICSGLILSKEILPHSSWRDSYLNSGCLGSLSLSSLLIQLLDGVFYDVGPEISLKVGDLRHTCHRFLRTVLEDILYSETERGGEVTYSLILLGSAVGLIHGILAMNLKFAKKE